MAYIYGCESVSVRIKKNIFNSIYERKRLKNRKKKKFNIKTIIPCRKIY